MPFLILMVLVIPLSRVIVGTSVGTVASIIPLVVAAFPFVARLVEASLREVDHGVLEAAQAMGCTPMQIIFKVMLPGEPCPSLINGFTTAFITILSYGAMSAAIGGGGLGSLAINNGYQRRMYAGALCRPSSCWSSWCRSSSPWAPTPPSGWIAASPRLGNGASDGAGQAKANDANLIFVKSGQGYAPLPALFLCKSCPLTPVAILW